jgi:spoIIIJ-associated protein
LKLKFPLAIYYCRVAKFSLIRSKYALQFYSSGKTMANQKNVPGSAAQKMEDFFRTLTTVGGLNLESHILACNGQVQPDSGSPAGAPHVVPTELPQTPSDSESDSNIDVRVEFTGPDTPLLLAHNGELLHAIEHLAAKILRLEPEAHDHVSFDAEGFKATRDLNLRLSAEAAIQSVRSSGQPYSFPPMTSRERRMLHLALTQSGLPTASSGEGPRRFVVLYPEGYQSSAKPHPDTINRTHAIRNSFRRR